MTQIGDDCFACGGAQMTTAEALAQLSVRIRPLARTERVPLGHAYRRVLAEDLASAIDVPPHANAAVDGYAFCHDDLGPGAPTRLRVAGRAAAGHPWTGTPARGEAVRIFTGAVMPAGCDTVLMQEDAVIEGDAVLVPPGLKRGANRRKPGEDVRTGSTILRRGRRLRPQDVALAASIGRADVEVFRPIRVALFSTGDELREPGSGLAPGAIHDANRYLLLGLLAELGCEVSDLGILPDRAEMVTHSLGAAARTHDLLITSGGVSIGEEDHVKAAVEAQGALHFWRLAIKPGRPIALGQVGPAAFIGLPGNPVAVMVCFLRFARPMILRLSGAADSELAPGLFRVRADFDYEKRLGRREWLRARLVPGPAGEPVAQLFERQGSGIITSLVASDGLVELGEDLTHLTRGDAVDFLPFTEVGA